MWLEDLASAEGRGSQARRRACNRVWMWFRERRKTLTQCFYMELVRSNVLVLGVWMRRVCEFGSFLKDWVTWASVIWCGWNWHFRRIGGDCGIGYSMEPERWVLGLLHPPGMKCQWAKVDKYKDPFEGLGNPSASLVLRIGILGTPGWLSQLNVWLRLRSWSPVSWVQAPHRALCSQLRAWNLLWVLCLPLSLPLPHSKFLSLSLKNK